MILQAIGISDKSTTEAYFKFDIQLRQEDCR